MSDAQFLVLLAVILMAGAVASNDDDVGGLAAGVGGILLGAAICVAWIL